jgi:hypothetical protein
MLIIYVLLHTDSAELQVVDNKKQQMSQQNSNFGYEATTVLKNHLLFKAL